MPLTDPQRAVIKCNKRFRVLISGRRFGKTFLAIQEMAKFARFPNQRVWYVSPSYRQSKTICWDMLKEMMLRHRWVKRINESDLSLLLKNNTLISLKGQTTIKVSEAWDLILLFSMNLLTSNHRLGTRF